MRYKATKGEKQNKKQKRIKDIAYKYTYIMRIQIFSEGL